MSVAAADDARMLAIFLGSPAPNPGQYAVNLGDPQRTLADKSGHYRTIPPEAAGKTIVFSGRLHTARNRELNRELATVPNLCTRCANSVRRAQHRPPQFFVRRSNPAARAPTALARNRSL